MVEQGPCTHHEHVCPAHEHATGKQNAAQRRILGMRKRRTEGGEEGLLLEGLQEGFKTGPSTSGRLTCVSGYHL